MKNLKKFGVAIALFATIYSTSAFASNTYDATAGTLRTDADNYLDVNYFNEVNFDNFFATTNIYDSGFQLGGAKRFNDIYLGAHYSGVFWGRLSGYNNHTVTKTTDSTTDNLDYGTKVGNNNGANIHNFDILLGLKNMGFNLYGTIDLGVSTIDKNKHSSSTTIDSTTTSSSSQNVDPKWDSNFNDLYNFNLSWGGMSFSKKETLIKPYAKIVFDFYNGATTKKWESKDDNSSTKGNLKDESGSDFDIGFNFGSEFVWGKDTTFMQVFNASNYFEFDVSPRTIYNKETTNTSDLGTFKSKEVHKISGKTLLSDEINTNYRFEYKPIENLTLGGKVGLSTTLAYNNYGKLTTTIDSVSKDTYYDPKNENYNALNEQSYKVFTSYMSPNFGLGLSYAIKPNFKINLGYLGILPTITVSDSTYEQKVSKIRDVKVWTGNWDSTITSGLVWDISKVVMLDVYLGIGRKPSLNDLWECNWSIGLNVKM